MTPALVALLALSSLFFAGASLLHVVYLRSRRSDLGFWATLLSLIAWVALSAGGVMRTALLGQLPRGSFSDGLLLFIWLLATGFFLVERRFHLRVGGAILFPLITLGVVVAAMRPARVEGLLPILQGPLVAWHVSLIFLGYCTFALAGLAGFLYLLQERTLKSKQLTLLNFDVPALDTLERLLASLVAWGYPCLTFGLLLGALWSRQVWGAYIVPDPKMLWAIATWIFYTAAFLGRWVGGWRGRRNAILTLVGFVAVLVNYVGITFIVQGIHRF